MLDNKKHFYIQLEPVTVKGLKTGLSFDCSRSKAYWHVLIACISSMGLFIFKINLQYIGKGDR